MGPGELVHAGARFARARERGLEDIKKVAERKPRAVAAFLLCYARELARLQRRYLRSTFGLDVLHLFTDAARKRFLRSGSAPKTDHDWARLSRAFRHYRLWATTYWAMLQAIDAAKQHGDDGAAEAPRAFVQVHETFAPWLAGTEMGLAAWESVRTLATAEFAGWALTKTSARRNRRLRKELGAGSSHDVYRELCERLPAAVLEAWYDLDPNEDPLTVRTHAANLLAGGGQRRRKRRPPTALSGPMRYDPTPVTLMLLEVGFDPDVIDEVQQEQGGPPLANLLAALSNQLHGAQAESHVTACDEFTAREEAVRMPALDQFEMAETVSRWIRDYHLSERQAQVAYLRSREWKHREVAAYLRIDEDTSRLHWHRAKLRMRRGL